MAPRWRFPQPPSASTAIIRRPSNSSANSASAWRSRMSLSPRPLRLRNPRLARALSDEVSLGVTTTVEALYEDGKLILRQRLPLPEKAQVLVTVESDTERAVWLRVSEQALTETWDNRADDVFNDLLKE